MSELKDLMEIASESSNKRGFWEDYYRMIKKMKGLPKHYTEKDIDRIKLAFYNEKISLISSELGEATEAMRLGKFCQLDEQGFQNIWDLTKESESDFKYQGAYITHIKDTFQDEIADSFIRLLDLCHKMDIDIERFIRMKMEYNKYRGDKSKKF